MPSYARTARKLTANFLQGSLLILLILMAVYVNIGRILINRINDYKSNFEEIVTAMINLPVSIGQLEGTWTYLDPGIVVRDLLIGTRDQPAIELQFVVLSIDTIASIRELKPIIKEIEIDGIKLSLQRDDEGDWSIRGMPESEEPFNPEPLLESVGYLSFVRLHEVDLDVFGWRGHYKITSYKDRPFELSLTEDIRTLSWPLSLSYLENPTTAKTHFQLSGMYRGDPRDDDFWSELYLNLPLVELTEFFPVFEFRNYKLTQMQVSGEIWLTSRGSQHQIRGLPMIDKITVASDDNQVDMIRDLNIEFAAEGDAEAGGTVFLKSLEGVVGGQPWKMDDVSLSFEPGDSKLEMALSIPSMNVKKAVATVLKLGRDTGALNAQDVIAVDELNPTGTIEDILIFGQFGDADSDFKVTALLNDVKIDRFKDSPAISKLDGFVLLTPGWGFIDVHNDAPFNMTVPALFSNPWFFDSAHTRIHYEYKPGNLKVFSGLVALTSGELSAFGKMFFNLPTEQLEHNWGLELGIRNAQLLDSHRYLPKTLPPELFTWLNRAVVGGVAREGGMVFHGSLNRKAPKDQKLLELYFNVEDTVLDYDPRWPRLDDLQATLYIGNREVYSDNAEASMFDSRVMAQIRVPISLSGLVDTIDIEGSLEGPLFDGIRMFTETPLYQSTNKMAEGWVGSGKMRGNVSLNIPFGSRKGEDVSAHVDISLDEGYIYMPQIDLDVANLAGGFTYDTLLGISSENFSAQLFDRPVDGTIHTSGDKDAGVISVGVSGSVDVESLRIWSGQHLLTRSSGITNYQSTLNIPYGGLADDPMFVDATSDLKGVAIYLPEPMGKLSEETVTFEYRQVFLDEGFRVEVNLDDKTRSVLKIVDGLLEGGRIHYGSTPMGAVTFDRVKVSGDIEKVVYAEWELVSTDLTGSETDPTLENELINTLDSIELNIGLLDTYGFELEDVKTYVTRNTDVWAIGLQNQMLSGTITVLDIEDFPLIVHLDVLRFESEESELNNDPMGDVDPTELVAVNFDVDKLLLNGEDYGRWAFDYRPGADGGVMENLNAEVKGLILGGGSTASWKFDEGAHLSRFSGQIQVPDLGVALKEWGFASSIEGVDFLFSSDITWPGSPAMVDLETVSGTVSVSDGKGRFVQADSNMDALKLLGIFDFASLARRFRLDFSDVVGSGFRFDKIEGSTRFSHGIVDVMDPIVIEGVSSILKVGGRVDLTARELDNDMIVTLPVTRNLPWYAAFSALATNPITGAGVFLAQKLFHNQINAISSAKYKITGSVDEPVIEFVSIFSDSVREMPDEDELPSGE